MFEVFRDPFSELYGVVTLDNEVHEGLSEILVMLREAYEVSTWENLLPVIERALNQFFSVIPGTRIPVIFVDKSAGRLLIKKRCADLGAEWKRRQPAGFGFKAILQERAAAVRLDTQIHLGRALTDIALEHGQALDGNPFVRDGYDPEAQRRINKMERAKAADGAEYKAMDTGRYFSVHIAKYDPPRVGDPRLHDRVDRALSKHCPSIGVYRGWQTVYDLWCRGDEAYSMTMRSLFLGARELDESGFGRLVVIKDKPTGPALVKLAAFSESFSKVFYETYFDGERREQDPRGWGVKEYEEACWAGDEAALDTPVFYTLTGTGLSADTARYLFRKSVRRAGVKCGDRYAWIHLSRHDRVETALAEIHAMDAPEEVKEALRERIAEYIAWAGGKAMLKTYSRQFEAIRTATEAVRFQNDHDPAKRRPAALPKIKDDFFADVFGKRG